MIHRTVLAACLARTNTGLHEPDAIEVVYAVKNSRSLDDAVIHICGEFMSDASHGYFEGEAKGFLSMMEGKSDAEIVKLWHGRPAMVAHCQTDINID